MEGMADFMELLEHWQNLHLADLEAAEGVDIIVIMFRAQTAEAESCIYGSISQRKGGRP